MWRIIIVARKDDPMMQKIIEQPWLFMAFVVKISSLSAIVACVMVPVYAYFIVQPSSPYFGTCIIIAILVVHRHKSNLINLLTGQEDRIGSKADAAVRED